MTPWRMDRSRAARVLVASCTVLAIVECVCVVNSVVTPAMATVFAALFFIHLAITIAARYQSVDGAVKGDSVWWPIDRTLFGTVVWERWVNRTN